MENNLQRIFPNDYFLVWHQMLMEAGDSPSQYTFMKRTKNALYRLPVRLCSVRLKYILTVDKGSSASLVLGW